MPKILSYADITVLASEPPVFQLLSIATPMDSSDEHLNPTWRGMVGTSDATKPSIAMAVKYLGGDSVKISIELACGLTAVALKLPVPNPAIIFADRADLVDVPLHITGDVLLLFGSTFYPEDTLWAKLQKDRIDAAEYVWREVCKVDVGGKGAAWDELIANTDRHHHNLIFDGTKWWLFDHDKAIPSAKIGYVQKELEKDFPMFFAKVNLLAKEMLTRRPKDHHLIDAANSIKEQKNRIRHLSILTDNWKSNDSRIQGIFNLTSFLVGLIATRLPALTLHISNRIGENPDSDSLWTSADQS